MNTKFKPLGLAAAVAAVTASYAGTVSAQTEDPRVSAGRVGDLAIIPYYTVQEGWVTGVHVINTSTLTQVVKMRLRRGSDSADSLDFNLILSPRDEWTGFVSLEGEEIVFATQDTSCTSPLPPAASDGTKRFVMPTLPQRVGAEEGYIEVIGMASVSVDTPIGLASKHANTPDGVPFDCPSVNTNFRIPSSSNPSGNYDAGFTRQLVSDTSDYAFIGASCIPDVSDGGEGICDNDEYIASTNALAVSYFFRDVDAGTEFGGNAVTVEDFSDLPWMTNQVQGLTQGDISGFDYPDLNGGPLGQVTRDKFEELRSVDVLGVETVLNDWSIATERGVSTNWVVTMPGQYTMIDYVTYATVGFDLENCAVLDDPNTAPDDSIAACDFRDLPVTALLSIWNREEFRGAESDDPPVVSPQPPGGGGGLFFENEVNIVEFTDGSTAPVLPTQYGTSIDPGGVGIFGWAQLAVNPIATRDRFICEFAPSTNPDRIRWTNEPELAPNSFQAPACVEVDEDGRVPVVGFVAWQRSFPANPDANYGRLIDHSFVSSGN